MDVPAPIIALGKAAKAAAQVLALATTAEKNVALCAMAASLREHHAAIESANLKDLALAKAQGATSAFLDRLALGPERTEAMAKTLVAISELPDPIGTVLATLSPPNSLNIQRVRTPIGTIGVIYESRPNVAVDAAGLCLKSGNAVILRSGSECVHSTTMIVNALHEGLKKTKLPLAILQQLPGQGRSTMDALLQLDQYIDVIVPRGGPKLIEHIMAHGRIPVFKHLAGLCHTYVHQGAGLEMARKIVLNAKMRRTSICGATEVMLIDEAIMESHLPPILMDLAKAGCEIRGDEHVAALGPHVILATENDYDTEFLDAVIAIKKVSGLSEALAHIQQHSTHHTDAIITDDLVAAERFLQEVDSAIVMHNASTQFADGGEFGMGAEIGIATGKLHARGPVGLEQLTTFKYQVRGSGNVR